MSRTTYLILPDLKIVKLFFSRKHAQAVLEITCFNHCACVIDSFNLRDHTFKTSVFCRGVGVKNWPNLLTDSIEKTADGGE